MTWVRVAARLALFVPYTALMYLRLLLGAIVLGGLRGGGWTGPATAHWRARTFQSWARGVLRILGIRAEVRGPRPEAPFFLVANHLGYVDVVVLAAQIPCVFVARADVAGWPVFGTLCRAADTIFIDRGNKRDIPRVIERIQRVLAGDRGVVVFPEGSSTKGAEVMRFRPSLLETAATAGIPVSYAALSYSTPPGAIPAYLAVCWWGDMTFTSHLLGLMGLPGIRASVTFGEETIRERDRKILAERLEYAVRAQFVPVVRTEMA